MGDQSLTSKQKGIIGTALGVVFLVVCLWLVAVASGFEGDNESVGQVHGVSKLAKKQNSSDKDNDWDRDSNKDNDWNWDSNKDNDWNWGSDGDEGNGWTGMGLYLQSSSCDPDSEVKPDVDFSIHGMKKDGALRGIQDIKIEVDHAKGIEVYRQPPGSLSKWFLCEAVGGSNKKWRCIWNTHDTPNGEYTIIAVVENCYGQYEALGPQVTVNNVSVSIVGLLPSAAPLSQQVQQEIQDAVDEQTSGVGTAFVTQPTPDVDDEEEDEDEAIIQPVQDDIGWEVVQDDSEPVQEIAIGEQVQDEAVDVETQREQDAEQFISELPPTVTEEVDSDGDGITNIEEGRLGTDALNPDTDGDGYIDGLEVARGYDPRKASPGDKIVFTQPKDEIGETRDDVYEVTNVKVGEKEGQEVLVIEGKARPLTFVTLFIYSELPLVVTVLADESGNFTYELSKTLDDGEHQVYIALADSDGFIVEKSSPFTFVKEAQAITMPDEVAARVKTPTVPPQKPALSRKRILIAVGLMVFAAVLMIVMLSLIIRKKGKILTSCTVNR